MIPYGRILSAGALSALLLWGQGQAAFASGPPPAKASSPPAAKDYSAKPAPRDWGRTPVAPPLNTSAGGGMNVPKLAAMPAQTVQTPQPSTATVPGRPVAPPLNTSAGGGQQTSRPAASPVTATPQGQSGPKVVATGPSQKRTTLDSNIVAQQSAADLAKVRAQQAAFKTPPPRVETPPATQQWVRTALPPGQRVSVTNYYTIHDDYNRQHPLLPVFAGAALGAAAVYGIYNADYLWHRMNDPLWMYNHQYDPAVIAFQRDVDRLSEQNAELRAEQARLRAQMAQQTGPRNENYQPADFKAELAFSPEVVTGAGPLELSLATGPMTSTYYRICAGYDDKKGFSLEGLKKVADDTMEVSCNQSAGAGDNVRDFVNNKTQAAIVTSDVADKILRDLAALGVKKTLGSKQLPAWTEELFLLVNVNSPIKGISDLKKGRDRLYVGPHGSGTEQSFQNLAHHAASRGWLGITSSHNDQYEGVDTVNTPTYDEAVAAVASDPNAVLLVMTPGHSGYMDDFVAANYADKVRLVPIVGDSSFTNITDSDGNYVYRECKLSSGLFPKLLKSGTPATLCVQVVVVVSDTWLKKDPRAKDIFFAQWAFMLDEFNKVNAGVRFE